MNKILGGRGGAVREIQIVGGRVTGPPTFEFSPPGAPPGAPRGGPPEASRGHGGSRGNQTNIFVFFRHFSLETGQSQPGFGFPVPTSTLFHIETPKSISSVPKSRRKRPYIWRRKIQKWPPPRSHPQEFGMMPARPAGPARPGRPSPTSLGGRHTVRTPHP